MEIMLFTHALHDLLEKHIFFAVTAYFFLVIFLLFLFQSLFVLCNKRFLFLFIENMRSELLRVQQEEMQRLHREFEVQLAAVKLQLQRTNEMHSQDVSYQL